MNKIAISEIFCSLQGEGFNTGRDAVFIRTSGCNLKCPWCDTDHSPKKFMTIREIIEEIEKNYPDPDLIVLTGGEPTIQPLLPELCTSLTFNFTSSEMCIETNGTKSEVLNELRKACCVDWITVSPKANMLDQSIIDSLMLADEIKVVKDAEATPDIYIPYIRHLLRRHTAYIQPCSENYPLAIDYLKKHPEWRLSVQIQKILKIS